MPARRRHFGIGALARVLPGILDQVLQRHAQENRIARGESFWIVSFTLRPGLAEPTSRMFCASSDRFSGAAQFRLRNARQLQQVVDQIPHADGRPADALQVRQPSRRAGRRSPRAILREAGHRAQRRAPIVRSRVAEGLQLAVGLRQRGVRATTRAPVLRCSAAGHPRGGFLSRRRRVSMPGRMHFSSRRISSSSKASACAATGRARPRRFLRQHRQASTDSKPYLGLRAGREAPSHAMHGKRTVPAPPCRPDAASSVSADSWRIPSNSLAVPAEASTLIDRCRSCSARPISPAGSRPRRLQSAHLRQQRVLVRGADDRVVAREHAQGAVVRNKDSFGAADRFPVLDGLRHVVEGGGQLADRRRRAAARCAPSGRCRPAPAAVFRVRRLQHRLAARAPDQDV